MVETWFYIVSISFIKGAKYTNTHALKYCLNILEPVAI